MDNVPYEFHGEDRNLLDVGLSLGFNIPYFCWHPAMQSVGACRQCAVMQFKDENDTRGRLVMACMTPASDGTHISIDHPTAKEFRAKCIEWLMVNHPHDCPVCDEGGECHLQDMTVMCGHVYRRFRFKKRTYRNQYLGPFVNHEMNRCIQCYRCVRFYRDIAGGHDFGVMGWHDHVYFGRHENGVLENEFSGNLVEVCPTGVFTDKTLKSHYVRKWDMQTAPSICVHCGLGCNTIPAERYGTLRRIHARYNGDVNGYFMCDRGRYGYEFVNSPKRIKQPLLRNSEGMLAEATAEAALSKAAEIIRTGKVIGIGSPRASLETNYALRRLVGSDRFYHGGSETVHPSVAAMLDILRRGCARLMSLREVEKADSVLVLGEDASNSAPMLILPLRSAILQKPISQVASLQVPPWQDAAVREAIQQERGSLFIASFKATKMDHRSKGTYHAAPDDIARLGFAVAHEIDPNAPDAPGLAEEARAFAKRIAAALKEGRKPLVVSGASCGSDAVVQAAANVAWALCKTGHDGSLFFTVPECNSLGVALMGGGTAEEAIEAVRSGAADTVIVAENDICRNLPAVLDARLHEYVKHLIAIDHLSNKTVLGADVVLPAATFVETSGTLANNEGRAQRFVSVMTPDGQVKASWRWIGDLIAARDNTSAPWANLDEIVSEMARELPEFAAVASIAPPESYRAVGQKIPRQPHRYSGRTAMTANVNVHEPQPPDDPDSPMSYSMEGYEGQPPSPLISRFWAPGWNSVQAVNKFQMEVNGPLQGGNPGKRLLTSAGDKSVPYFSDVPEAFKPRDDEMLVVPAWHIFGSEELSMQSPGVAELAPEPYVAVNAKDAERIGLKEGDAAALYMREGAYDLPLTIIESLPDGVAAIPAGIPTLLGITLPAWGKIKWGKELDKGSAQ